MTEFYTSLMILLFPFAAVAAIEGAMSIARMYAGLVSLNGRKVVRNLVTAAGCTGALWAYLMIPGGLG